jgi:integrase/recombinase XerD
MATVEECRRALGDITVDLKEASAKQYVLRAKSLMSYAHELGYTPFNAGMTIKIRSEGNRGGKLATRIITETEVALLIRYTHNRRDRELIQVAYAGGLRVSKIVGLNCGDVINRNALVQLNVTGKGGVVRNVLLPEGVSHTLRELCRGRAEGDPVFVSRGVGALLFARCTTW